MYTLNFKPTEDELAAILKAIWERAVVSHQDDLTVFTLRKLESIPGMPHIKCIDASPASTT